MSKCINSASEISDTEITTAFQQAEVVKLSVRNFNYISYRKIHFGNLGWWLPLSRVLPLIGATPEDLRPVFDRRLGLLEREWWQEAIWKTLPRFARPIFGSVLEPQSGLFVLPAVISSYDELGYFTLEDDRLVALARVLGKAVEVMREDGGTGEHYKLCTVYPSGQVDQ